MKAAIFNSYGDTGTLEIEDIPRPQIAPAEILVGVRAAAVNPKDTFIRKGYLKRFTGNDFPMLSGFDYSGQVVEVGSEVATIQRRG